MIPPLDFPSAEYEIKGSATGIDSTGTRLHVEGSLLRLAATSIMSTRPAWQGAERMAWDLVKAPMAKRLQHAGECYQTAGRYLNTLADQIEKLAKQMAAERTTGEAAYARMNAARKALIEAGGSEMLEKVALGPLSWFDDSNEKEIVHQSGVMWSANGDLDASRTRAKALRDAAEADATDCSDKIAKVFRPEGVQHPTSKPARHGLWGFIQDSGDDLREGAEWLWDEASDTADGMWDFAARHGGAFVDSLDPFVEAIEGRTVLEMRQWLWLARGCEGDHPKPVQFVAADGLILATGFGSLWSLKSGKNEHFMDDGDPVTYAPYRLDTDKYNATLGPDKTQLYYTPKDFTSLTLATFSSYGHVDDNSGQGRSRSEPRVIAVRNPGQPTRYIIAIPGTDAAQTKIHGDRPGWSFNDNGHNWAANGWGVAFGHNTYSEATQEAIDRAIALDQQEHGETGSRPDVLLTGHSQGGITAVNVASNNDFASKYHVRGVVTYGSPIGAAGGQYDAPTLALQNGADWDGDPVPNLDMNPDNASNVTQLNLPAREHWVTAQMGYTDLPVFGRTAYPDIEFADDAFRNNHAPRPYIENVQQLEHSPQDRAVVEGFERRSGLYDFYATSPQNTTVYVAPAGAK